MGGMDDRAAGRGKQGSSLQVTQVTMWPAQRSGDDGRLTTLGAQTARAEEDGQGRALAGCSCVGRVDVQARKKQKKERVQVYLLSDNCRALYMRLRSTQCKAGSVRHHACTPALGSRCYGVLST